MSEDEAYRLYQDVEVFVDIIGGIFAFLYVVNFSGETTYALCSYTSCQLRTKLRSWMTISTEYARVQQ